MTDKTLTVITVESLGADNFVIRAENYYQDSLDIDSCVGILARLLIVSNEIRKMDQILVADANASKSLGPQRGARARRRDAANV